MSKRLRIVAVVVALGIGGIAAISTTTAVPPAPKRYYHLAPGGQCSNCEPVVRETCQLTGCLPTFPPGGDLCQYNCFGN